MFNFVYKTILHHAPTQKLYFHLNSRYISNNATQHSFTVSYLINSCGFSLQSALSASEHVHFETPDTPDAVLHFFKKHHFSQTQIKNLTIKLPQLLLSTPEETLFPKLNFFQDLGLSSSDIAKLLTKCPLLFNTSIEQHLAPSFGSFSALVGCQHRAIAIIKTCPSILYNDLKDYVEPNVRTLLSYGVPRKNILMFLQSRPHLIITRPQLFKEIVALVKEMDIAPFRVQFIQAILAKRVVTKSQWGIKLDIYKRWGLSEKLVLATFRKYPWCMIISSEKIEAVMDIFVDKLGWQPSVIAEYPILVTQNMEKTILPRVAVFQFLFSIGLNYHSEEYDAPKMFFCGESTFLGNFECCLNEDVYRQVCKLYQEKIDLSKKTSRSNAQGRPKDHI